MVGCQQIRQEIKEFGEILTQQPWYGTGTGVEIGLGFYGSTHIFWRNFFAKTITIEYEPHRIRKFKEHTYQYYKKNVLDEGSYFINNYSYSPEAVGKLYNFTDKIDFLFIDGDHIYQAALTDWLLYSPLVAKGGIVAFHDSCCEGFGVSEFLKDLQTGAFGEAPKVELIQHSKCVGISYYFKP
jgi:predicted O-methyltransferase YrrM